MIGRLVLGFDKRDVNILKPDRRCYEDLTPCCWSHKIKSRYIWRQYHQISDTASGQTRIGHAHLRSTTARACMSIIRQKPSQIHDE